MADPLSIAASAIAVAGAGFKLADTIRSFVDNVRKAERHLRPIAQHVDLTSSILDTIGDLLGREKIQKLCHDRLLVSIKISMKGCRDAFRELEDYLNGLIKAKRDGSMGLTGWNKAFWSYRQKEIDVLQAHLERFKSSLDLVLNVLTLISTTKGRKISDQEKGKKSELNKLMKAKDLAAARDIVHVPPDPVMTPESSQTNVSSTAIGTTSSQPAIATGTRDDPLGRRRDERPSMQGPGVPFLDLASRIKNTVSSLKVSMGDQEAPGRSKDLEESGPSPGAAQEEAKDGLLQHLGKCAEAVAILSSAIEDATKLWQASRQYERYCIVPAYEAAQTSIKRLRDFEEGLDLPSKKPRVETELQYNDTVTGTVSKDEKKDNTVSAGPSDSQKPRSLTFKEQLALQKFNRHASSCRRCHDVYKLLQRRKSLCTKGEELARNVTEQLQYVGKGMFSATQPGEVENTVPVRLGAENVYAVDLLKARFRFPTQSDIPTAALRGNVLPAQKSDTPRPGSSDPPGRGAVRRDSARTNDEHYRAASDYPVEDIIDLSVPLKPIKKERKKANKAHRDSAADFQHNSMNYVNGPIDPPPNHPPPQDIYPHDPFAGQHMPVPPQCPMPPPPPQWQPSDPVYSEVVASFGKQPSSARNSISPNPFQPHQIAPLMFDQPQEYPDAQPRSRNRTSARAQRHLDRAFDEPDRTAFDEQDEDATNNSYKLRSGTGVKASFFPEAFPNDLESSAYGERLGKSLASEEDVDDDKIKAIERMKEQEAQEAARKSMKAEEARGAAEKKCKEEIADEEEEDFSAVDRLLREWTLLEV